MRTVPWILPAVAVTCSALVACGTAETPRETGDQCPTPTAAAVRENASRAAAVLRVTVLDRPLLTDGVTTSQGLLVRVDDTLAGAAAPDRVAIWPSVDTPSDADLLGTGTSVVVFASPHERRTSIDNTTVPGYGIPVTNGLLAQVPAGVVRLCKGGQSAPAAADVLDGL